MPKHLLKLKHFKIHLFFIENFVSESAIDVFDARLQTYALPQQVEFLFFKIQRLVNII